jgi:hypothetical protein
MSPLNVFFDNGLREENATTRNGVNGAPLAAGTSILVRGGTTSTTSVGLFPDARGCFVVSRPFYRSELSVRSVLH